MQTDPLDRNFSAADRRTRQAALMSLYDLQKSLAKSLAASRAKQQPRLEAEFDRLLGVAGMLLRSLEEFNSVPTADQRQQIAWALDDAKRAIAMLDAR